MLVFCCVSLARGRRRILRIDQHDVGTRRLQPVDAVIDQRLGLRNGCIIAPDDGVGADLPDDEIGLRVQHRDLHPLHHLHRVFAADAPRLSTVMSAEGYFRRN